ncbi:hypothetical protein PI125_g8624 [Phytophthora idaei]|nr:hypothetical protein PI125_g8624 [Phytophthora idaei]
MTKFDMSQDLDHAAFPHLTRVEWEALHRLAAVSGEAIVTSLLRSAMRTGECQLPRVLPSMTS